MDKIIQFVRLKTFILRGELKQSLIWPGIEGPKIWFKNLKKVVAWLDHSILLFHLEVVNAEVIFSL